MTLLGHVPRISTDPLGFLESLAARGDLVEVKAGPWRGYVACHPDVVSRILLDDRTFDKGGPLFDKALAFLGDGVGTCPHHAHRRLRRLVQPAFHRDRLLAYSAVMSERIDEVTGSWRDDMDILPAEQMFRITTDVMATCLLGARPGVVTAARMRHVNTVLTRTYWHMFLPTALRRLPTPGNRRFRRATTALATAVRQVIGDYRRGVVDSGSLLPALIDARDEDAAGHLSEAEIHDQVITFLLAGAEPVADTLAWACYLLAGNPEVQDRLHDEARAVLGGRVARSADLPLLELTGRVLNEALRLYPPGWLFTRVVTEDTELAGHRLRAGSAIAYSPYLLHRNPDLFPNPALFDPDRWLPAANPRRHRGFLPFAAGARQCVGDNFAFMEASLALATVADRWRLERHPAAPAVRPRLGMTLRPTPVPLRVRRRPGQETRRPSASGLGKR